MYFSEEEINDHGKDPEQRIIEEVVHWRQLLLAALFGRHDGQP